MKVKDVDDLDERWQANLLWPRACTCLLKLSLLCPAVCSRFISWWTYIRTHVYMNIYGNGANNVIIELIRAPMYVLTDRRCGGRRWRTEEEARPNSVDVSRPNSCRRRRAEPIRRCCRLASSLVPSQMYSHHWNKYKVQAWVINGTSIKYRCESSLNHWNEYKVQMWVITGTSTEFNQFWSNAIITKHSTVQQWFSHILKLYSCTNKRNLGCQDRNFLTIGLNVILRFAVFMVWFLSALIIHAWTQSEWATTTSGLDQVRTGERPYRYRDQNLATGWIFISEIWPNPSTAGPNETRRATFLTKKYDVTRLDSQAFKSHINLMLN